MEQPTDKLIADRDLPAYGIRFSRQHIHRLEKAGRFPAPVQLQPGGRKHRRLSEILALIAARGTDATATAGV